MNKNTYRIIFSQSQQQFIVVSELAKSKTSSERRCAVGNFVHFSDGVSIDYQDQHASKNDKSNDRLNALQSAALAAKGYGTYQGLSDKGYLIKGEVGVGFSQSKSDSARYSESAVGNHLNGAEGVSLTARRGNIDATYTTLTTRDSEGKRTSGGTVEFDAAGKILLNAGVDGYRQQSSQRSSGAQVGVGYSVGGQTGVYAYVEAGYNRSGQQGEGIYHHNSVVDADKVIVKSRGDTTLNGAEVHAKQIQTRIGGDLTINSLQDSEQQRSSGSSVGGRVQVSFGTAWEASANASAQQGSANRQQVNRQSGLFAEEHYDVEANNVHLNGGAITGKQTDKNRLVTNKLTFNDIENRSESKAVSASIGVSASSDLNKDENGKVIKNDKGEPERVTDVSPTGGLPMYSRSKDSSVTKATLSEGTIILDKDSQPTQTTAAALGINSDSGKGNAQTEKPKDINTTLATQKAMQSAVADISAGVASFSKQQHTAAQAEQAEAQAKLEQAAKRGNPAQYEQAKADYDAAKSQAEAWGTGGDYSRALDTASKVISLALANGSSTQLLATALSPEANKLIKASTTDKEGNVDKAANLLLHGILSAVEAQVNGGSALGGAAAAMTGEATAELLATTIYGKSASELNERERQNISALSSLSGALAATVTAQADGTATDSTTTLVNAAAGQAIAESAVENNNLAIAGRVATFVCARACQQALAEMIGLGAAISTDLSQNEQEEALKIGAFKNPEKIAELSSEQIAFLNSKILDSEPLIGNNVWIPTSSGGFMPVDPNLVVTTYGGKQIIDPRIIITDTGGIQYPSDYEKPNNTGGDQIHVPENTGVLPGSEIKIGSWEDNLVSAENYFDKPKKKVNSANIGDFVRTPTTNPEDFTKNGRQYKNNYTDEIWEKSNTQHSDKLGEWKVGLGKNSPSKTKKITVGVSDGKIIKIDSK
ncbi:hemagglutinin repeat-containing protein [Testudinibacter sp. P80/BLE/0925]|uniref:hemagglutinin repeat-containing protein n=1 Tax=Testudinibacter sp. TW-1 TaxID=3417757 RepID=UPI003D36C5A5